jgi:hypothetical protein
MQKVLPQSLGIPHTQNDMVAKISETGIMFLQSGKFKKRHYGCQDLVQRPNGWQSLSTYKKEAPKEFLKPKPCRGLSPKLKGPEAPTVLAKEYRLNKTKVASKLRTMYKTKGPQASFFMITITFPQGTTDAVAYLMLNKWLTRLRQDAKLKSYLWVAERQQNGTIHYHMAVHQYINIKNANRYMRACLFTCIDQKLINWSKSEAIKYNGIDLAKDRKTKRVVNFAKRNKNKALAAYLTKYVTKNDGNFQNLCWHCSRDYSNLVTSFAVTLAEYLQGKFSRLIDRDEPLVTEWFRFYRWKGPPPDIVTGYISNLNTALQQTFFIEQS